MDSTVAVQLQHAASLLGDEGRLEAELLLAHVLGKPRSWLMAWPDRDIPSELLGRFMQLVVRRQQGEPVAYILGEQEFWSLPLQVTPATLIPRPDTEVLVEAVLHDHAGRPGLRVLDAGTGSGAIALALGKERPQWQIFACDCSWPALQVAQANACRLEIPVSFVCSDWLAPFIALDLVVSNPPYIAEGDRHLPALAYEPQSALVAAEQGLADIMLLAAQAHHVLKPEGALYIEHGYDQADAVQAILAGQGFLSVRTGRDYAGNNRFTCGVKPCE